MKKAYLLFILTLLVGFSAETFAQCTSCTLNGPSSVQRNNTVTFSTSSLSGTSYFWSVTGGLQLMSGNTGTSVTVKAVGAVGTTGRVCVARYGNGKVPCSFCKTITITGSSSCTLNSVSVAQLSGNCNGTTWTYRATPNGSGVTGATYSWQALGDNVTIISGQGTNTVTIRSNTFPYTFIGARATVTACGTSKTGVSAELCEQLCGDFICRLTTAPNPSKDGFTLTIAKGEKTLLAKEAAEFTVQLLNKHGKVVKEVKTQDTSVFIDTKNIDSGVYVIRALHASGQSKTETIVINK